MWNRRCVLMIAMVTLALGSGAPAAQVRSNQDSMPPRNTQRPPLHGTHWMAITGKPLGATAGAMMFQQGGNAIDAACAMLGAVATMWDTLGWGGETQALIYNPNTKKVIGINALGVAPTGATVEYYKSQGYNYPPEFGPLAADHARHARRADDDARGVRHAVAGAGAGAGDCDGRRLRDRSADRERDRTPERRDQAVEVLAGVFLPHQGETREAPEAGEIFRQADLAATLRKLVEAEAHGAQGRQVAQGSDSGRLRSVLQGRHRAGDRPRHARGGRALHDRRSRELAGEDRRAALDELQGHRRLQARAVAAGARCCCRR